MVKKKACVAKACNTMIWGLVLHSNARISVLLVEQTG